ncbi:MAG: cytochrome P460 family protein [Candidatus Rariloculaceae bacterium]
MVSGIKQWFVIIKDSEGRFAGNPLWGEGWGWVLFQTGDNRDNVATSYASDCLGCHVPARDNDWVYIEAYPTLQAE